ncbi:unnamed protein product [Candida verbasci]|uniref:HTH La-type RNA-binding domain-containing protein n=1 Tax=Candida verbasci TaxID=1227364 RepID=A0A9W4TTJ9_9ASCO|nr:unnamed protein product [Candida verbasci]
MSDFVYQGDDFEDKVRKQVEFYFSDSNLQTDKFMLTNYQANDGWVELKTILTFGRMKQYRPEEKVIEALKKSDKLKLSANNDMITRIEPVKISDIDKNERKKRTIHIEGFPKDLSQDDVESWFHEKILPFLPNEKVINTIRRVKSRVKKEFFGVVDAELKNLDDVKWLLEDVELSFEKGIVTKMEASDVQERQLLKKMSLLTHYEMKETGKRFGQNEVTKRRNSFNDSHKNNKKFKGGKNNKNNKNNKGNKNEKLDKVEEKSTTSSETNSETKSEETEPSEAKSEESKPETKPEESKAETKQDEVKTDDKPAALVDSSC